MTTNNNAVDAIPRSASIYSGKVSHTYLTPIIAPTKHFLTSPSSKLTTLATSALPGRIPSAEYDDSSFPIAPSPDDSGLITPIAPSTNALEGAKGSSSLINKIELRIKPAKARYAFHEDTKQGTPISTFTATPTTEAPSQMDALNSRNIRQSLTAHKTEEVSAINFRIPKIEPRKSDEEHFFIKENGVTALKPRTDAEATTTSIQLIATSPAASRFGTSPSANSPTIHANLHKTPTITPYEKPIGLKTLAKVSEKDSIVAKGSIDEKALPITLDECLKDLFVESENGYRQRLIQATRIKLYEARAKDFSPIRPLKVSHLDKSAVPMLKRQLLKWIEKANIEISSDPYSKAYREYKTVAEHIMTELSAAQTKGLVDPKTFIAVYDEYGIMAGFAITTDAKEVTQYFIPSGYSPAYQGKVLTGVSAGTQFVEFEQPSLTVNCIIIHPERIKKDRCRAEETSREPRGIGTTLMVECVFESIRCGYKGSIHLPTPYRAYEISTLATETHATLQVYEGAYASWYQHIFEVLVTSPYAKFILRTPFFAHAYSNTVNNPEQIKKFLLKYGGRSIVTTKEDLEKRKKATCIIS